MKLSQKIFVVFTLVQLNLQTAWCNERTFAYSYEPETMPAGVLEFEQWVTLRSMRNKAVGQKNFSLWELREELEYGVTDNYTVSLYLNTSAESFHDVGSGVNESRFCFDGLSIENRYMLLNPAEHAVGLTVYLEPRFSGQEAELEEKIILGKRHNRWNWSLNLSHATEWSDHLRQIEGEIEVSFGLARRMGKHWSIGIEVRDHNELPDYRRWENTALFLGPVASYRREKWWATLAVLPQIYGSNFGDNPDENSNLELEGHERLNVRLILGLSF